MGSTDASSTRLTAPTRGGEACRPPIRVVDPVAYAFVDRALLVVWLSRDGRVVDRELLSHDRTP
jgi:hypothetical protein